MPVANGKWYESSAGTGDLAATIKGLLIGVLPLLVFGAKAAGVEIGSEDLRPVFDNVENVIIAVGGVIATVVTLFGLVRKLVLRFKK